MSDSTSPVDEIELFTDSIVTSVPEQPRSEAIYYGDPKTGAISTDPHQQSIKFTKKAEAND